MELQTFLSGKDWKHKNMLLVENEEESALLIKEMLGRTGLNILHATHANDAININKEQKNIEVVVMNIRLPDMDSFEAAITMIATGGSVPMVFISGSCYEQNMTLVGKSDLIYDFIYKPVDLLGLTQVISKYLNNSGLQNNSVPDQVNFSFS